MGAGSCNLYLHCIRRRLSLEKVWKTKFKIVREPCLWYKKSTSLPKLSIYLIGKTTCRFTYFKTFMLFTKPSGVCCSPQRNIEKCLNFLHKVENSSTIFVKEIDVCQYSTRGIQKNYTEPAAPEDDHYLCEIVNVWLKFRMY